MKFAAPSIAALHARAAASAGQLAVELGMGPSALSQHLNRMREQGLISQRRQTRQLFYRINESTSARVPVLLAAICAPPLPLDRR